MSDNERAIKEFRNEIFMYVCSLCSDYHKRCNATGCCEEECRPFKKIMAAIEKRDKGATR